MGLKFVHRVLRDRPTHSNISTQKEEKPSKPNKQKNEKTEETTKPKNKKGKKDNNMDTIEQIEAAQELANELQPEVKVVKKERGLIERTESSKIILTEDNRQVLND